MLINIIGPIAVGKSTFCKKFIERHPEFVHAAIDDCRAAAAAEWKERNPDTNLSDHNIFTRLDVEETAWMKLFDLCINNPYALLETAGLSWRLKDILHYEELVKDGIYTVKFTGDRKKCHERLDQREANGSGHSEAFPYEFNARDGIDWMIENIHRAPHNLLVNVDSGGDYEKIFKEVEDYILSATLKYKVRAEGTNFIEREIKMNTKITDVRFFNVKGNGKVRAFAAVTFNGEITVRGYKVVQGTNGLFIGKPSQLNARDQKWYDNVNYVSEELQTELHSDILNRYQAEQSGSGGNAGFNQTENTDDIPF